MTGLDRLLDGYRAFRRTAFRDHQRLYRELGEHGQSPRVMVIACCDSRVDPMTIFSTVPGELFVVRNVANLVPPYEPHGDYHGTSAALEFAVTGLGVETILVLGHARCGGVQAFLEGLYESDPARGFIAKWMSLLRPALARLPRDETRRDPHARQRALEQAAVVHSLANLATFPFVKERVERGALDLRGGYFAIATGELWLYDPAQGFARVED